MTWFLVILCQTTLWSGAALFIARRWKDRHPSLRRRLWTVSLPMTLILPLFSPVLQLDRVLGWSALNFSEQSKVVGELPELVPAVPSGTFEGFDAGSAMAMAIEPAPPAAVVPLPQEQQPSSVNAVSVGLGIYLLVATLLLIRVLLGLKEVYAWRRESVACSSERLGDAFEMAAQKLDLSNACEIRLHPKLPLPLTVGVRRPTVLFPQAMVDSLSGSKLQAIALHESNHARNHDPLWFFVNNGLRALMWFQPLIWLVHRRFVMAAKECSDMKVVDTAGSPWGYS
ncbi:MAG: M56 family metallopeptidase, partial [Verrucomicrobiales bacterium]